MTTRVVDVSCPARVVLQSLSVDFLREQLDIENEQNKIAATKRKKRENCDSEFEWVESRCIGSGRERGTINDE